MGAAEGHGRARDPGHRFADEVLGAIERRQGRGRRSLGIAEPRRVIRQEPGGFQIDAHLRHVPAHVRMIGQGLGEAGRRSPPNGLDEGLVRRDGDAEIDRGVGGPRPVGAVTAKRDDIVRPHHEGVVRHPALVQHHGVAPGRPHPQRVPHLFDASPRGLSRHQQDHRRGRRGRLVRIGHHRAIVGGLQHRRKGLAPGDAIAAVHAPGARQRHGRPDQPRRGGLRVVAGDELLVVHHHVGHSLLGADRHERALHERPDDRQVHVERQGGRRAALGQLLGGERVAEQAHPGASELGGDVERVEPGVAERRVVLQGMARLAVMLGRARREVGRERPTPLLETTLVLGDVKLHAPLPSRNAQHRRHPSPVTPSWAF